LEPFSTWYLGTALVHTLTGKNLSNFQLLTVTNFILYETQDLLSRVGYELIEAVNGEDGVNTAAVHMPDLILMDIQLPGMDGYEAARRIKANPKLQHIPIIAVTSYALSGDDVKAYEAGCNGYVAKPFSPRALLAKIREYLP
jgi:two-component system cell cycle response regulator DivK